MGAEDDISEADASDTMEGPEIDHFDFGAVLPSLPYIEELSIVYGVHDAGMNFEWNLFQVRPVSVTQAHVVLRGFQ